MYAMYFLSFLRSRRMATSKQLESALSSLKRIYVWLWCVWCRYCWWFLWRIRRFGGIIRGYWRIDRHIFWCDYFLWLLWWLRYEIRSKIFNWTINFEQQTWADCLSSAINWAWLQPIQSLVQMLQANDLNVPSYSNVTKFGNSIHSIISHPLSSDLKKNVNWYCYQCFSC